MSDWRIRRHYGYGVAGLALAPTRPHAAARRPLRFGEALAELRRHGADGARQVLGEIAPGVGMGAALVLTLLLASLRPMLDVRELEIVRLEPAGPEVAEPPVEVVPPPVEVVPPPVEVAPEPVETVRAPDPAAMPEPVAPPQPGIAPAPARPETAPLEIAGRRPRPEVRRIEPVAAPRTRTPSPPPPMPARALSPPRSQSPRRPAALPSLAPLAAPELPATSAPGPRRRAPARVARAEPRAAAPRFDLSAPTSSALRAEADPVGRGGRPAPREPLRPAPRPSGLRAADLAAPPASPAREAVRPAGPVRVARAAPETSRSATRAAEPARLAAVPLSALAACVSDREEDALKLEVLAEVRGADQCASEAGRYRFVETRNLNAFLMRIERAPTRRKTDRCIELRLALECLRARRSGGSRSG